MLLIGGQNPSAILAPIADGMNDGPAFDVKSEIGTFICRGYVVALDFPVALPAPPQFSG
jgi:hypothetical protein